MCRFRNGPTRRLSILRRHVAPLTLILGMVAGLLSPFVTIPLIATAQPEVASVSIGPGGIRPNAVAVQPGTNRIFVASFESDNILIVDGTTGTVTKSIPVGRQPLAFGVDPQANRVYVANRQGNSISV